MPKPLCVYCGEREAVGFEAGRLVCQHCQDLSSDPIAVAVVALDEAVLLSMTVQ